MKSRGADKVITQEEFKILHQMKKYLEVDTNGIEWPKKGKNLVVPCFSTDNKEEFDITINRGRIEIRKINYQELYNADKTILFRIDNMGPPHMNPDGIIIECPHIHIHKEGYGTKWAYPLSDVMEVECENPTELFKAFLEYINIVDIPDIKFQLELVDI